MSKTIDLQIEKSTRLIEALKAHIGEFESKGLSMSELKSMQDNVAKLKGSALKTEEIRAQLSDQVKTTNSILAMVKQAYAETKAIVRNNYPQEEWINYGVTDKR